MFKTLRRWFGLGPPRDSVDLPERDAWGRRLGHGATRPDVSGRLQVLLCRSRRATLRPHRRRRAADSDGTRAGALWRLPAPGDRIELSTSIARARCPMPKRARSLPIPPPTSWQDGPRRRPAWPRRSALTAPTKVTLQLFIGRATGRLSAKTTAAIAAWLAACSGAPRHRGLGRDQEAAQGPTGADTGGMAARLGGNEKRRAGAPGRARLGDRRFAAHQAKERRGPRSLDCPGPQDRALAGQRRRTTFGRLTFDATRRMVPELLETA